MSDIEKGFTEFDRQVAVSIQGKTIVFVSHGLSAVQSLCQRAMLLNEGKIISIGATEKVINDYLAMLQGGNT